MERRKEVGRLDIENPKPKWNKTIYLKDGKLMKTIHDGNFSPTPPTPTGDYMYLEAAQTNSTVSMVSTLETAPNFEYSLDGVTWHEWVLEYAQFETITLEAVGERIYIRGDNPDGLSFFDGDEYLTLSQFKLSGKIRAGGNIMSLLDKKMNLTVVPNCGFLSLFDGVGDALISAPSMDTITAIGTYGCTRTYYGCSSLTSAADMPSLTTIGNRSCTSMYVDCSSLTTAADMSSLTTIGDHGCNDMYSGCSSLTTAADMPSLTTIGDYGCSNMYSGCSSLTTAADMPSLTTIGYSGCSFMYSSCNFDMSDDGTTLNFAFQTPPITAGEDTFATAYDVAEWMGNTNGFENQADV